VIARRIAACLLVILCVVLARGAQASEATGIPLVDQSGATFTLADMRGTPVVVTFVATRCTDTCPIANGVFSQLAAKRVHARLVTITLDPIYDTPFVMAQFAREFAARPDSWRFASGRPADIERLLHAFGVARAHEHAGMHDAPDVHSTFAYLIGVDGRLAKVLPLSTNTKSDVIGWLKTSRS